VAKVVMVGAGSVEFTRQLTADILSFPELNETEFVLVDIDPVRLETAESMVRRLIAQKRSKATVSATMERRKALAGADYVINIVQVGGFQATLTDFQIPKKYGLKQTIADTLGVGGVFRALRTIPVVMDVVRDMEEVCPKALLLNYANPMAMVMLALGKAGGIASVGLCHSIQGTSHQLASYVGVPFEEVTFRGAGINHQAWILELSHKGRDLYPDLWKAMQNPAVYGKDKVRFEIMRRVGYFPTESSEHSAEYLPYFMKSDAEIQRLDIPVDEYIRRSEDNLREFDELRAALQRGDEIPTERSWEYAPYIIWAKETNTDWSFYGNVYNRGLITNVPADAAVEVPCLVNRNGIQPCVVGDLPTQCAAINRTNINVQELAVEAALTGDRDRVYQAVMVDPNASATLTLDKIWAMTEELLEAHKSMIPTLKPRRLFF